jgi:hypothetical protein
MIRIVVRTKGLSVATAVAVSEEIMTRWEL